MSGSGQLRLRPSEPMATACPQWDQKPTWVSRSSQCLCQEPCAAREKPGTCGARNHTPSGNDLLGQYQNRDRGDPQYVHHPADEEQCHQRPPPAHPATAIATTAPHSTAHILPPPPR